MARLTRIYTRTGDDGNTGLADGQRVSKDCARVEAMGDVDELNSCIGLLRAEQPPGLPSGQIEPMLTSIQHRLFDIGGELAIPGQSFAQPAWAERLENWIDQLNQALPPLAEFVLPGGNRAAAQAHLARATCRRAERSLLRLSREEAVNSAALIYLNRLSDLLFVIARTLARADGGEEVTWQKGIE